MTAELSALWQDAPGIVSVLGHGPGSSTLETRLLEDLRQCVALDLPVALFVEKNVRLDLAKGQDGVRFQIGSSEPLFIEADLLHGPTVYLEDAIDRSVFMTATDFQDSVLQEEKPHPALRFLHWTPGERFRTGTGGYPDCGRERGRYSVSVV